MCPIRMMTTSVPFVADYLYVPNDNLFSNLLVLSDFSEIMPQAAATRDAANRETGFGVSEHSPKYITIFSF